MQITSRCALAILVLRGSCEKQAMEYKNYTEIYGAGKIWPKEYWTHLANQLKSHDYITIKKLPLPYRPIQIISSEGFEWLKRAPAQRLILKAKPEMYQYFKKKRKAVLNNAMKVPTTSTAVSNEVVNAKPKATSSTTQAVAMDNEDFAKKMELSDEHLERILLDIRSVVAENIDISPPVVASQIAIEQMVEKKPMSMKEFQSHNIEGFSTAKTDKFAKFFIDGILKFMVSRMNHVKYDSLKITLRVSLLKSIFVFRRMNFAWAPC